MPSGVAPVISRLQEICGREYVLTHQHELATYRSDGLLHYRQVPVAAVLPGTAEQVRQVVQACFEAEVPWVARGSGTGLSGGALPVAEGVLIVLSRLRRILSVDLDNGRVVVEPGVTNLAVSRAVAPTHFYPPDPSSQIVCSIGGNVAENSGGAHCFKYGFTTNYVIGLEVVLSDGSLVTLDRDAPGYDLLGAFVGSEGTLGVATQIALRVVPAPESVRTHAGLLRGHRLRRRRGHGDRRRRDRSRRDRDDGPALDRGRRAGHRRGLPARRRRGADRRARRPPRGVPGRPRAPDRAVRAGRRAGRADRPVRGRARPDLAHPQGGVRVDGADRARLLRAGRRHSPHPPVRGPAPDRRAGRRVRPARRQRLSRRRRQPAPARLLRLGPRGRGRACRGAGRA